ncbi:hypothetical protein QM841_07925 [Rhodococcus sp. IEGM 1307]|nr:hypothetical protein [Rhodococcus sp. IEGM 1307]MDI9973508.1 hypothetical protein [Rhodococcus sp. IEGM 1307]
MSRSDEPDSPSETDEQAVPSRAPIDRARLERVFGDVFPDTTADEREPGGGSTAAAGDEWLRRQRPPHHG